MALIQAANWLGVEPGHPFGNCRRSLTARSPPGTGHTSPGPGWRSVTGCSTSPPRWTGCSPGRADLFATGNLDVFLGAGDLAWTQVREAITAWLSRDHFRDAIEDLLVPRRPRCGCRSPSPTMSTSTRGEPCQQREQIFRPGSGLSQNWRHQPIGYHGRAGRCSCPAPRCAGRTGNTGRPGPQAVFAPSARLDFEAELGFVVGFEALVGEPVRIDRFREHVLGVCLVNDWSARDVQTWEYGAARPVPRQVVRHHGLPLGGPAGRPGARPGAPAVARSRAAPLPHRYGGLGTGHRLRGQPQRPGHLRARRTPHVLEPGAEAGPHDRERGVPADR